MRAHRQPLPSHSRYAVPPLGDAPLGGPDVADRYIEEHATAGDVAVTADIPLAAALVLPTARVRSRHSRMRSTGRSRVRRDGAERRSSSVADLEQRACPACTATSECGGSRTGGDPG